jgi:N-formylglutamate amidohydrolase
MLIFRAMLKSTGVCMFEPAFQLFLPKNQESSVLFAAPHSGRDYTDAFLNQTILDAHTIRSSEDAYIDDLFAAATAFGSPLLVATAPRAFIDLNRASDELDPAVIEGISRLAHNPRVSSGLGVIPRVVSGGRAIYRGKISLHEAERRIKDYWHPYHDALRNLIEATHRGFGQAILIDCHSMPREAIEGHVRPGKSMPEVVLGDRFGAAAGSHIMDQIEVAFTRAGFRVARNAPFAGAFVSQSYGRPSANRHVIQVEIDRSLYLDEAAITQLPHYADFKASLAAVIKEIAQIGTKSLPLAAE